MCTYKTIVDTTTNRGEFNRAYKLFLEHSGKIHCSRCGYHRGENEYNKWYGGYIYETKTNKNSGKHPRHPSWKLVSKNRKQWMKKPIKIVTRYYAGYCRECFDITW